VTCRQVLPVVLLVLLLAPACNSNCSGADSYSGSDVLPREKVTADELLAKSQFRIDGVRSWIPDPSEFEEGFGPIPPLPHEGLTSLEITVMPLSDVLTAEYSPVFPGGCEPLGSPTAPVRITLRTSDGVLNEEVTGTVHPSDGAPFVFANITEPNGSIKEYFAGFEDPNFPKLQVALRPGSVDLRLVIERRRNHGAMYDYVTLL